MTDSKGNVYTRAVVPTVRSGQLSQSIYYAKNIVGAVANTNTVTVQFTVPAIFADIRILEYSGLDQTNPVDITAAATETNATSSSGAATTPRGKIHRINKDGTIPTDNPFYDGTGLNWDSIWASGCVIPSAPTTMRQLAD